MNEVGVEVELTLESGRSSFEPGARVSGIARWAARSAPARLELHLWWISQGHGGRDLKIVETVTFAAPQREERRPFILALPVAPYSFRGALISLSWMLELTAFPSGESTKLELTIAPGGQAIDLR